MDSKTIAQGLGIFILVVMAFSMLAGAFLYVDRSSTGTTDNTNIELPVAQDQAFTYSISFDANTIKDLWGVRIALATTKLDKAPIDSAILKLSGVSKVDSKFVKTTQDANYWTYLADITLKKDTEVQGVLSKIIDLNYFEKSVQPEAVKKMTINSPESVLLHNADLNIDRNFSFTTATLPALVGISTGIGDEIRVSGSITLQGKAINQLDLFEQVNLTQQKLYQELINQQLDQNKPIDTNTPLDSNTPKTGTIAQDVNLPDSNTPNPIR